MIDRILFMVLDEKSNKVQIIHSIIDLLVLAGTTATKSKVRQSVSAATSLGTIYHQWYRSMMLISII